MRWPFGYGLSYTSFTYTDLKVENGQASVTITNTGDMPGAEIAQLYVQPPQDGIHRPIHELKSFWKIFLQPGESRIVSFPLDDRYFAVWQDGWRVPEGDYTLCVGPNSRELPLTCALHIAGEALSVPAWQKNCWYETCQDTPDQALLEATMGRKYTPVVPKKGAFTMDNTVEEMKDSSLVMRIMYKAVENTVAKGFGGKKDYGNPDFRMMMASIAGSPLRSMQISGGMKGGVMPSLLEMANGHFLTGIVRMMRG